MPEKNSLLVTSAPHIADSGTTRGIMLAVVGALLPTLLASAFIFGPRVLLLTGVTVSTCVGFECLYCLLLKKPLPLGDFSAVVTGLILAFNLPPSLPLWMASMGSFVAIVIVKQLFGGLGHNFANPALIGRMALQISFTGAMTSFTTPAAAAGVDVIARATPLAVRGGPGNVPLVNLLLGVHGGTLGETCAVTLLLGGLFLMLVKVISPVTPLCYIGGLFVLKVLQQLAGGAPAGLGGALSVSFSYLCSGGLLLGAFFMATDYTTSPYTARGKLVFGLGLAALTFVLREWGGTKEGVSYALLLMSLLVPYINDLCRTRPLGVNMQVRRRAKLARKEAR